MLKKLLLLVLAPVIIFSCSKKFNPIAPVIPVSTATATLVIAAPTDTSTAVSTAVNTATTTAINTAVSSQTFTRTPTSVSSPSATATRTAVINSPTNTQTATLIPAVTGSFTITSTNTPLISSTFTRTVTLIPSVTSTHTLANTMSATPSVTETTEYTFTITRTYTRTFTVTRTFTITRTVTATPTVTGTTGIYKTFGGAFADYAYSVTQTADGGYAMFGTKGSSMWAVKTDNAGNVAWDKTYFPTSLALCGKKTQDGGYIMAGYKLNPVPGTQNVIIVKVDSSGDCVWAKEYGGDLGGGAGVDYACSVDNTTDGGYIISGATECMGVGGLDEYLIRVDSNGDCVWARTYGTAADDKAWCVEATNDGGFIVSGESDAITLRKLNSDGSQAWYQRYGSGSVTFGKTVRQTSDGGYIVAGALDSGSDEQCYLMKTTSLGATSWWKTFGDVSHGDDWSYVEQTPDNGYIMTGWTSSYMYESLVVQKTDSAGNPTWVKLFDTGDLNGEVGTSIHRTSDGGYILSGYKTLYGNGDALMIKIDSAGNQIW